VIVPIALFGWKRTLEALNIAARDTFNCRRLRLRRIIVGVVALTGIGGRFSEMILVSQERTSSRRCFLLRWSR